MRQLVLIFACLLSCTGCGKFLDKFSRLSGSGTTELRFTSPQGTFRTATQSGGVIIYILDENEGGVAVTFANETAAMSEGVVVPNGTYTVQAYSFGGPNIGEGQARCGFGNDGNFISLNGSATTVAIDLTTTDCAFGTASEFADANNANSGSTNFDPWTIKLCSETNPVFGTCTDPGTANRIRITVLAGQELVSDSGFIENPAKNFASNCYVYSAGQAVTAFSFPFGSTLGIMPPIRVEAFSGGACTPGNLVDTWNFIDDGPLNYLNATTQPVSLHMPAASSTAVLLLSL